MTVFIAGGTGYMGRALIPELLGRGHAVRALVRPGSESKLPPGCSVVTGSALDSSTFRAAVAGADAWVHLIGVAHPSPAKAAEFRSVDLVSVHAAVEGAKAGSIRHFVYLSVAQPAPVMQAYIEVRAECEALIGAAGFNATFLRPWYVLGPGHRWPVVLKPLYWLFERIPGKSETARRLGLCTLAEMSAAILWSVENSPEGIRILDVPAIRAVGERAYSIGPAGK